MGHLAKVVGDVYTNGWNTYHSPEVAPLNSVLTNDKYLMENYVYARVRESSRENICHESSLKSYQDLLKVILNHGISHVLHMMGV